MLRLSPRKVAAVAVAAAGKQNCCEPHSNLKSESREKKNVTGNKSFARVTRQAAEAKVAR